MLNEHRNYTVVAITAPSTFPAFGSPRCVIHLSASRGEYGIANGDNPEETNDQFHMKASVHIKIK